MDGPAAGRLFAELVVDGRFRSADPGTVAGPSAWRSHQGAANAPDSDPLSPAGGGEGQGEGGIGTNTAIFSIARSVAFEPSLFRDPDRAACVQLYLRGVPERITDDQVAIIRRLSRSLERVEVFSCERPDWRRGNSTVRLFWHRGNARLPPLMDVGLLTGRYFTADDVTAGSDPALITEDLWNHEFGRATNIVGRSQLLGDVPVPVPSSNRRG